MGQHWLKDGGIKQTWLAPKTNEGLKVTHLKVVADCEIENIFLNLDKVLVTILTRYLLK